MRRVRRWTPGGAARKNTLTPPEGLPWSRMLRAALDAGIDAASFWRMSPAAIVRATRRHDPAPARRMGSLSMCP